MNHWLFVSFRTATVWLALLPTMVSAISLSWDDGAVTKNWGSSTNWNPNALPTGNDLFIGDLPAAQFDQTIIDQDYEINSLTISSGADADTDGNFLDVNGDITLSGPGTSFIARQHTGGAATNSVDTFNININSGAVYRTEGARTIVAVPGPGAASSGTVNIAGGGVFSGWGTLRYQDGLGGTDTTQFFNEGTLRAARNGLADDSERFTLTIESGDGGNNAFVDLDGSSDNGTVNIDYNTTLDIETQAREFWGTMNLEGGSVFEFSAQQLVRGTAVFNIDAASLLTGVPSTATIRGPGMNSIGNAQFNINSGTLVLETDFDSAAAPDINMANNTGLTFDGPNDSVFAGDLNMDAEDLTLTVSGTVTINDNEWNWDGLSGHASTTIVNDTGVLNINSDSIETNFDGQMDGRIEINGGTLDAGITGGWTFGGELVVDSTGGQSVVRGTPLTIADGSVTVGAGSASTQIDTSVTFTDDAFTLVEGTLVLGNSEAGHNIVFQGGSNHAGTGTLGFGGDIAVLGSQIISMSLGTVEFDRGGNDLSQTMDLNADLVVSAKTMGVVGNTNGTGQFTLNINNSTTTLTVEITGEENSWTLGADGTINITAAGTLDTSIAGDDFEIEGTVNIDGDTRFGARFHLQSGGLIDLPLAIDSLTIAGGNAASPNTIAGGIIDGTGMLKSNGTASLAGHGTINVDVEFTNDSNLRADGGTLVINGEILDARFVGANDGGTLLVTQTLDTGNLAALELAGGIVSGAGVVNGGLTRGYGIVNVANFKNNGLIFGTGGGSGQALVIGATGGVDLDGDGLAGEVQATSGDVTIVSPLTDDFGGTATVGQSRTLEFQSGWTLGTNGTIQFNGAFPSRAVIDSPDTQLRGSVDVTSYGRFVGSTTFRSDAEVSIVNTTDRLEVDGTAFVRAGATFTGAGALSNMVASQLTLDPDVDLDVPLLNSGQLVLAGEATVLTFDQVDSGEFVVEIAGTGMKDFGHLIFDNTARIDGDLLVNLTGGFTPLLGHEFGILTGLGGVTGTFDTPPEQLPSLSSGLAWEIDYTGAEVILRVVAGGLAGDFNGNGVVDLADYTVWRDNLGAASEAALNGNGDNVGGVDAGDYLLWKAHFGEAGGAIVAATSAVPEPAAVLLLAVGSGLVATLRSRRML